MTAPTTQCSPLHAADPCSTCGMSLWVPIAVLQTTRIGLYDDGRFPGRCLVMLNEHVEQLEEVPPGIMVQATADLNLLARALKRATGSPRLNYAVLGNAEAHVHWHVIPRYPLAEKFPSRAPWDDPRPHQKLSPSRRSSLIENIKQELGAGDE